MPEIRKGYFTEEISIVAPERGLRPNLFLAERKEQRCPFCPGNEELTPPADLVIVKRGETLLKQTDAEGDTIKNWTVRVFPAALVALHWNVAPAAAGSSSGQSTVIPDAPS